jgi:DNA-binding IclR family transcriptional regulator
MDNINMVQKTIDILDYVSNHPKGVSLSAITGDLKYPKTTIHDILKTLMQNDFVQYVKPEKKSYCIGAQVYAIGFTYLESSVLFRIAKHYLILFADKYEKTTFLSKRHHDRVICVYKYASVHAKAPTGNIGDQKRLHSTAIGKCYLAFDRGAASLINTIDLPSFTPYTITDRKKLKAHIEELRAAGYSWEQRESHLRMACLAAPIFLRGAMIGTISMTGWYREDEDFTSQGNEIAQLAKLITAQMEQSGD